jgi:hypothetical protein
MAQEFLNLNEESFERLIELLSRLSPELREHFDRAVNRIAALSGEWNDEDYQTFFESVKNIEGELNDIDGTTIQLLAEVKRKLEVIRARSNINL